MVEREALVAKFADAIGNEDFPSLHLAIALIFEQGNLVAVRTSQPFCRAIVRGANQPFSDQSGLCEGAPESAGEYGELVVAIAKRYVSGFGPRPSFPPGMSGEDLLPGLLYVQPAIEELFIQTIADMDALEPPAKYREGHGVLRTFFQDLLHTAYDIDRAVEAEDADQIQVEFRRSGEVAETAEAALPENYKPLVTVIFTGLAEP